MIWPIGRRPGVHRHQWSVQRGLTVPMWDRSGSRGELWRCTVEGCGKVHAR